MSGPTTPPPKDGQGDAEKSAAPYRMTLSLNVLNHLGISLYSNVPAVLAETVANAWDADAELVDIRIDSSAGSITITDYGHGMTRSDINNKYLHVGYQRREHEGEARTPKHDRPVMGRKGIGKLSLFSIADTIEVYSVKNGERNAFRLDLKEIQRQIKEDSGVYRPTPIDSWPDDFNSGTRIILTSLRKRISQTEKHLRRRLARRFSVIGPSHKFKIQLNGKPILPKDRGYFDRIEYLWHYGETGEQYAALCTNAKTRIQRSGLILIDAPIPDKSGTVPAEEVVSESAAKKEDQGSSTAAIHPQPAREFTVEGWVGTVFKSTDLKDDFDDVAVPPTHDPSGNKTGEQRSGPSETERENLNRVVLMIRGKMAQEDILRDVNEGRLVSKYIIGELHADFLDLDDRQDTATSSRQSIIEDDPRYKALVKFLKEELSAIATQWENNRAKEGTDRALEIPHVNEWFKRLGKKERRHAESLFGKINRIPTDAPGDKKRLFQHAILAFESMRFRDALDRLEEVAPENLVAVAEVFANLDEIEAGLYYQIAHERVSVIDLIKQKVDKNVLDQVLAAHLFDHLWLLDPSFERATEQPEYAREIQDAIAGLSPSMGRVRVQYSYASGKHVVIDLYPMDVGPSTMELLDRGTKLRNAVRKVLRGKGKDPESIEVVAVIGKEPADWKESRDRQESQNILRERGIRALLYREMLKRAKTAYAEHLRRSAENAGQVMDILRAIDKSSVFG